MPTLKDSLRELFPTEDLKNAARSRSGARLVRGKPEPEMEEVNYLPLLSLILGAVILGTALLKPQRNGAAGLQGAANPPSENYPPTNWQQQEESSQTLWPEQ